MTDYEWDLETWNDTDCLDHDAEPRLADLLNRTARFGPDAGEHWQLVLVRNSEDGERCWAYVQANGQFDGLHFRNAWGNEHCRIPVRFVRELARRQAEIVRRNLGERQHAEA